MKDIRNIKDQMPYFKAWDHLLQKMVSCDHLATREERMSYFKELAGEQLHPDFPVQAARYVVFLPTGLRDKNRKAVCSDDIIRVNRNKYLIRWDPVKLEFLAHPLKENNFAGPAISALYLHRGRIEIIGHLYESPVLLMKLASGRKKIWTIIKSHGNH